MSLSDKVIEIIEAVLALILAAAVGYGVWLYKDRQYQHLQQEVAKAAQVAEEVALQHSKDLASAKATSDQEKDEAIKRNTASYTALVNSLRQRAARPAGHTSNTQAVASCDGTQLYREDAEFLAGEAARADQAIIDRDYYYGQYESVRKLLNPEGKDVGQQATVSDSKSVP